MCDNYISSPRAVAALRRAVAGLGLTLLLVAPSCFDETPGDFGRTRSGPGATVRYDLGHKPLPDIPLPNDTATWPDPTSRTGLRLNASLIAPTNIEAQARKNFSQMEGWGTFAPIWMSFDVPAGEADYQGYKGAALDLTNVVARHQGDDYDFGDDAVYLINLKTGVPMVLDVGNGNFPLTLRELDKYWANDTRNTERNLLFETIDETNRGAITEYAPEHDTDFDGVLDVPNLVQVDACDDPDPRCDDRSHPDYATDECFATRRERDQCIADNLMTWYERETDTLVIRPLLPLDEMTQYAVVITDRLIDGRGNPVKSPFEFVFHATQGDNARRVSTILNSPSVASYYGDLHGTGIDRVGFVFSFTTQPTVDDMKRLRDGLYGHGPFARWAEQYPATAEIQRTTGLNDGLAEGATDAEGWVDSELGKAAGCPEKVDNLWIVKYDGLRDKMKQLVEAGFGVDAGPDAQLLLRKFDNVSHFVFGTFKVPFLLEGGPGSIDPNAAFNINYTTGDADETSDTVQFWLVVPKETDKFKAPFDVSIFGHGYTSTHLEQILYAGNMAEHGIASIGINAMGHGLEIGVGEATAAVGALGGACYAPGFDAFKLGRMRDLNHDGEPDSGGDFWSSYMFHTRDGVRQSILDHLQLVRIMRQWGQAEAGMTCRNDAEPADRVIVPCDTDGDGELNLAGDFNNDGVVDVGGSDAVITTWGESLGGILSGIHGAIDPSVTAAVPGSGGGGLTDIGIRSFQGGVVEAVTLRLWGPLVVTVPAEERKTCTPTSKDKDRCTVCADGQLSVRWVLPDVNGTGEVEIDCLEQGQISETTVRVVNIDNKEVKCARVDDEHRFRVGVPATFGDRIVVQFYEGRDVVDSYDGCRIPEGTPLKLALEKWGVGRFPQGSSNPVNTAACGGASCASFQGVFFPEGSQLTSPGDGFGLIRQTPALRRLMALAQAAIDPADPISFAPFYAIKTMTDPAGNPIPATALLTLNTIGDQNVPLNSGIAFARASGALPFLRPDQAALYPEYIDYVTPAALFKELGKTPNQQLIDQHLIEGITKLGRYATGDRQDAINRCIGSANYDPEGSVYLDSEGATVACWLDKGCTEETESDGDTRICAGDVQCDFNSGRCVPRALFKERCEEALYDADDLDEGKQLYFEEAAPVPHRLARLTASARDAGVNGVWAPRLRGAPFVSDDQGWSPQQAPEGRLTALLNAYTVPQGEHTFVNGNPCHSFDHGTYLTNLVARFFQSDGTDIYYLSHPATHHCLEASSPSCEYQQ
jgi:hypothetical protein